MHSASTHRCHSKAGNEYLRYESNDLSTIQNSSTPLSCRPNLCFAGLCRFSVEIMCNIGCWCVYFYLHKGDEIIKITLTVFKLASLDSVELIMYAMPMQAEGNYSPNPSTISARSYLINRSHNSTPDRHLKELDFKFRFIAQQRKPNSGQKRLHIIFYKQFFDKHRLYQSLYFINPWSPRQRLKLKCLNFFYVSMTDSL